MNEPIQLVVSADNMDDETFARHMEARHQDSMGVLTELNWRGNRDLAQMWRIFHARLHRYRVDFTHEHADYQATSDGDHHPSRPREFT